MSRWIPQVELLKLWGKSRQTGAEWCRRPGCPKRTRNGKTEYQWPEFLEWWASEREAAARRPAEDLDREAEQARKLKAEADLKELELAERRGILVPASEYEARLDAFLGRFSAVAQGQLARYERDIVAASTPAEARKITMSIQQALMQGAQGYADTVERGSAEEAAA